jgi:hypothetical protein
MLNVEFKRNSEPIDDAELLSVLDAIQREAAPLSDLALLLAKMIFRIQALEARAAGVQLVPVKPTSALLRPFCGCLEDELELAWAAMIMIAAAQQKVTA